MNWDKYQEEKPEDRQASEQATDNQPTGNRQPTDTNKKDKKDKNKDIARPTDPRVKVFIDWWYRMYEKKFKRKYAISNGGKIGNQVKGLLKSGLSFQELQIAAMGFLLDEDPFLIGDEEKKGAGHEIGVFMSRLNKYDYTDQAFVEKYKKFLVDEKGIAQPIWGGE